MSRPPDWTAFADRLGREQKRLEKLCPKGACLFIHLEAWGFDLPEYRVSIVHREHGINVSGKGSTPTEGFEAAGRAYAEEVLKARQRPRLEETKALPPAKARGLFD